MAKGNTQCPTPKRVEVEDRMDVLHHSVDCAATGSELLYDCCHHFIGGAPSGCEVADATLHVAQDRALLTAERPLPATPWEGTIVLGRSASK